MGNKKRKLSQIKKTMGLGSVQDTFAETFNGMDARMLHKLTTEKLGAPMYTQKDVDEATHPLIKLLRQIFVDNEISHEYLREKHNHYCIHVLKKPDYQSSWGNLNKLFKKKKITWGNFEEIVFHVLGYQFGSIRFDYVDESGSQITSKV